MSVFDDVVDSVWDIGGAILGLAIVKKGIDTITGDSSSGDSSSGGSSEESE